MSSEQRNFQNLSRLDLSRLARDRDRRQERRAERRRKEQMRRKERRLLLTRDSSTNFSERFDPRSDAIPPHSTPQRTKRRAWCSMNKDCLKLINDCQEIIGRLQTNVNHISNNSANLLGSASNFINHDNLLHISTETQPESSFRNMLERLNHDEHYQPHFITRQTIERLMSSSHPSSSLCPLQIIEISLVCPLSKTKIKLPIRGKHCMHLGCCDASTFLSLVGGKPLSRWKCPICSLPMPYEDIKVDGLLSDIIKGVKEEAMKIEFTSSTTWTVKEEKETSLSTHKLNKKTKEIIDLTYSPRPMAEERGSECHFIDLTNSP